MIWVKGKIKVGRGLPKADTASNPLLTLYLNVSSSRDRVYTLTQSSIMIISGSPSSASTGSLSLYFTPQNGGGSATIFHVYGGLGGTQSQYYKFTPFGNTMSNEGLFLPKGKITFPSKQRINMPSVCEARFYKLLE